MTPFRQKQSGLVHVVASEKDQRTLCGRWAGRGGNFRPAPNAEPTCWVCLAALAARERQAA